VRVYLIRKIFIENFRTVTSLQALLLQWICISLRFINWLCQIHTHTLLFTSFRFFSNN